MENTWGPAEVSLTYLSCCEGLLLVGNCLLLYFKDSLQRKWNDLSKQVTMLELQYSHTEDEHPSHISLDWIVPEFPALSVTAGSCI